MSSNSAISDWSAHICPAATLNDLDPAAIAKARLEYKNKHPELASEVEQWDDITFLNKAKILQQGRVTRIAILLLGKPEATHYLLPAIAQIVFCKRKIPTIAKLFPQHEGGEFYPPCRMSESRMRLLGPS